MQKESFWSAKRVLLERKRSPFGMQKDSFRNAAIEKRRFCTCFYYSATHFRLPSKSHFGKRLALLLGMIIELSQMGKQLRREHAMLKEMFTSLRLSCGLLLHFGSHNEVAYQAAVSHKRCNL